MKRFLWIATPILVIGILLNSLWIYSERRLSHFLIENIQSHALQDFQTHISIKDIQLNLAPPSLTIKNIHVDAHLKAPWLSPIQANEIRAQVDFLNLLAGQIKLSLVKFKNLTGGVNLGLLPENQTPLTVLPIDDLFEGLKVLPIKRISIEDSNVNVLVTRDSMPLQIKGNIFIENSPQGLFYGVKIAGQTQSAPTNPPLNFVSKGLLTSRDLHIQKLRLDYKNSFWSMDGEFSNFAHVIKRPQIKGAFDLSIDVDQILNLAKSIETRRKFPALSGIASGQGHFQVKNWKRPAAQIQMDLQNFVLQNYALGRVQGDLKLKENNLNSDELSVSHRAGEAKLYNTSWNLNSDQFLGSVKLSQFNLQTLFQELKLTHIPVELQATGQLQCSGQFLSRFGIECQGAVEGQNLDVRSVFHGPPPPIVTLKSFKGEGFVTITSEEVRYSSSLVLPHSRGRTQGVIDFEKGFTIDFDSESFDFKDLPNLAGLSFEGQSRLKGRTQGNSSSATLDISLSNQNFWFEDYSLGSFDGKVSYSKGHLFIDAANGSLYDSHYLANIDVDLTKSTLSGIAESPDIAAVDAVRALTRKVPVPFSVSGRGKTRARFEGPFSLGKLTYRFEGHLEKGDLAGEAFDELRWDFSAKQGQVLLDQNFIRKGRSLIEVKGSANPLGDLDLSVTGRNLKLENSTFLSQFVKTLGGDLSFEMRVKNHILKPHFDLSGQTSRTTLGDSELPDSRFEIKTDSLTRRFHLDLLGHRAIMNLNLPYLKNDSARLQLDIDNFDYAQLIGLVISSPIRSEYQSNLKMSLNLNSDTNDLFESSGIARIDELSVSRSTMELSNPKPMIMTFHHGVASLKDFSLLGPQSDLTVNGINFSPEKLNFAVAGNTDIKLIQIFLPFLDDLNGSIKGQMHFGGSLNKPEIYGSIDFADTALRIKGLAPLFEHLTSHLEFSQKKILVESIRGSFAGGTLAGDGVIEINGPRDIKVAIKSQLRNLRMEVPEHVRSAGTADIVLAGNWFPYTLSGSYRVQQAFVDLDFTKESKDAGVRHSIYLPKNIAETTVDPIVLDLQVFLDKKIEIKNPQIAGFLTGQLQIKGPPQSPILLGSLKTLPQAQLFSRDQAFDIQTGLVKFNDTTEINPQLYFDAHTIVDKYEINLLLQGRAKSPQLTFTSQPFLPEQDIISLLALGMTTQKLDSQIESSQQAAQTGYQLGTAIISANPLNREIKQSLGVDVKFSSGFDETKNLALPRVTISKDLIPRKLTASATSSFSENQNYDVRFQYLLNEKVSTVVTYERSENPIGTLNSGTNSSNLSVFGLDLEYKVEFK